MTNQIPEEVKKQIEEKYPAPPADRSYMYTSRYLHKREGAEWGYTLGLQSAEKRVKELEEAMQEIIRISDRKHWAWDKAKQLLTNNG